MVIPGFADSTFLVRAASIGAALAVAFTLGSVASPAAEPSTRDGRIAGAPASLAVSADGRYLVGSDGKPFFYLADTAWELFHRLDREEALEYLDARARAGFTVVQAVALAELDGLNAPSAAGHRPLAGNDPARPLVRPGPDDDYWDHVDAVIKAANDRGLVVALLPSWGDKWSLRWGVGPIVFDPENARAYGAWIGKRYRHRSIIWVLGGDRNPETAKDRAIIEAMAQGVREGAGPKALMTFHPMGGAGSSDFFADAPWMAIWFRQNGHRTEFQDYLGTSRDYRRTPVKPVIDGEPLYEDHPIKFEAQSFGYSTAYDVRRPLYWNLFMGAAGHAYGHHSVWQMYAPGRAPVNAPLMPWREALNAPGGRQMQFAKALLQSRPNWQNRVPADDLIVGGPVHAAIPGAGVSRMVATIAPDRSWAMVYAPVGRSFEVDTSQLPARRLTGWWYDPRTGAATRIGVVDGGARRTFAPPTPGEYSDWVLVLDDADRHFAAPGSGTR